MIEEPSQVLPAFLLTYGSEFVHAEPSSGKLFQASPVDAAEESLSQYAIEGTDNAEALAVNHDVVEVEFDIRPLLL